MRLLCPTFTTRVGITNIHGSIKQAAFPSSSLLVVVVVVVLERDPNPLCPTSVCRITFIATLTVGSYP